MIILKITSMMTDEKLWFLEELIEALEYELDYIANND